MRGIEPDLNAFDGPDGKSAERLVLREEDLFPMALPAAVSAHSSEGVEDWNVARIRLCVSVTGTADERWTNAKQPPERMDYVSFVGHDALLD